MDSSINSSNLRERKVAKNTKILHKNVANTKSSHHNPAIRPKYNYSCEYHPFIGTLKRNLNKHVFNKFLLAFFGIILLPIRVPLFMLSFLIWYLLACTCPVGESDWRFKARKFSFFIVYRFVLFLQGVYYIEEINTKYKPKNPKLMVVAPHSSVYDGILWSQIICSAVISDDFKKIPILNKVMDLINPIYVNRDIQHSRKKTVDIVLNHCNKPHTLPVVFYPEGTTTNGKTLIHFKAGAFLAGLPISPVLIRLPKTWPFKNFHMVQWTWVGTPEMVMCVFMSLALPYQRVIIEWLPEYVPSKTEQETPELYAYNMQNYFGKKMNTQATDYVYDDGRLLCYARKNGVSFDTIKKLHLIELYDFVGEHVRFKQITTCLDDYIDFYDTHCSPVPIPLVAEKLNLPETTVLDIFFNYNDIMTPEIDDNKDFTILTFQRFVYAKCKYLKKVDQLNINIKMQNALDLEDRFESILGNKKEYLLNRC